MSSPPPIPFRPPSWLLVLLSAAVSAHLFIVLMNALGARTGPWQGENGQMETLPPPQFAERIREATNPTYLRALKMTHDYHYSSNIPDTAGVDFAARIKGSEAGEQQFPDPKANAWVRFHQRALAQGLFPDERVIRPTLTQIPAEGRRPPTVVTWTPSPRGADKRSGPDELQLRQEFQDQVGDDRPANIREVWGPSALARILSRSYGRYVCRSHDAESAQIVRRSRRPILATILTDDPEAPLPADVFDTLHVNFGEVKP